MGLHCLPELQLGSIGGITSLLWGQEELQKAQEAILEAHSQELPLGTDTSPEDRHMLGIVGTDTHRGQTQTYKGWTMKDLILDHKNVLIWCRASLCSLYCTSSSEE